MKVENSYAGTIRMPHQSRVPHHCLRHTHRHQLQPSGLAEPPSVCGFSPRLALAASDRHRQPARSLSMSPPLFLLQPAILQMTKSGEGGGGGGGSVVGSQSTWLADRVSGKKEMQTVEKSRHVHLPSLPPLFVLHCISSIHCTRLHATLFLCATGCVVTALAHLVHVQLDTFFF